MNFIREKVSGKKNRLKDAGYNLDLTYVCPRIIGMSFPGSGFEVTFRNNIEDVSQFIKERHGTSYKIFNLSGRGYNYSKFDNRVLDFPWEDHHSPPIATLFQVCKEIDDFLQERDCNVVVVHCLAGKGRTGTAICCYLLYSERFSNAEEALDYYAKKRFLKGGGVTQPSQRRYVQYFGEILKNWKRTPILNYINTVTLFGVPRFSSTKGCRPFIEIYNVRDNKMIYTDKTTHTDQKKYNDMENVDLNQIKIQILSPFVVIGDVLIRVLHNGRYNPKFMCRFAFNTAFLPEENSVKFYLKDLDPDKTVKDERFPKDFYIQVVFAEYCKCTNKTEFKDKCSECSHFMDPERKDWEIIYKIMQEFKHHPLELSQKLLFGDSEFDDLDEVLLAKGLITPLELDEEQKNVGNMEEDDEEQLYIDALDKKK